MSLLHVVRQMQDRRRLFILAAWVILVILLAAAGQVRLNEWQGSFYDAISHRDMPKFEMQLGVFLVIVSFLVVLGVAQTWLQEMIKVQLREALTRDLLDHWLQPKRAYRLSLLGEIAVNPDQRLQEDARHLTELTANLGIGLFQSSVLLVSFVGVLWVLSARFVFTLAGHVIAVPGYMVWCALIYALAGSALTFTVGRPLIRFNADRYAREADLRFALVRTSESSEGIALDGGERAERAQLQITLDRVLSVMRQLANGVARLTWVTSSYGYVALVVPIAAASPGYFAGTLSFGELMMVVGAFFQVQQALRWFVDNFATIADWSATFLRVMNFHDALTQLEKSESDAPHITIVESTQNRFAFADLGVLLLDGKAMITESPVEIRQGEHVQIQGGQGAGKTTLFRAFAGLWPAGFGRLELPPRARMMLLPQRPYLPLGTLHAALAYPALASATGVAEARRALERVGLGRLVASLEDEKRWDKDLTLSEQQCLAFAGVLLHAPDWVIMDGALEALDGESRQRVLSIFTDELAGSAVISIGAGGEFDRFFTRTLHLKRLTLPAPAPLRAEMPAPV